MSPWSPKAYQVLAAFLTPRDKKLSLSSSVEKSSEFGWLENENEMKNEREGKTEQGSVYSIYDI